MVVILFDGVCNLCNGYVQYLIRHDRKKIFYFSSLQSPMGQRLLLENRLPVEEFSTFYVIVDGAVKDRSDALIEVLYLLGRCNRLVSYLIKLLPKKWRDYLYTVVAKHRYQLLGKSNACLLPTEATLARFVTDDDHPTGLG